MTAGDEMFIEVLDTSGIRHLLNVDFIIKVATVNGGTMLVMDREKIAVKEPSYADILRLLAPGAPGFTTSDALGKAEMN